MFIVAGSHHLLPRCRTLLASGALFLALGFLAPGRSLADEMQPWTPSSTDLIRTPRPCPSTAIARYYDASCWSVTEDHSSPFYSPEDPLPWGQCTYWALEMRPDLWNNRSASDPRPTDWTAYTWPEHASLEGLTVDRVPAPAAIMLWPKTSEHPTGHVAVVQSVGVDPSTGDDVITIQELNNPSFDEPSQGQGDTLTIYDPPATLAGVQFIHEPPSADTATSDPATPADPRTPSTAAKLADPHLTVKVGRQGLRAASRSPAPISATITSLHTTTVIRRTRLRSRAHHSLPLQDGHYHICVSQAPSRQWRSAHACVSTTRPPSSPPRR